MLFGCARLLNGQSSTPNSNWGCQPALYGTGRLAALANCSVGCSLFVLDRESPFLSREEEQEGEPCLQPVDNAY